MGSNHHSHGKSDPEINISIPGIFVDAEPYRVAKWSRAEIRPKLRVKNVKNKFPEFWKIRGRFLQRWRGQKK